MHKSLIENANAMAFAKVGIPSTAANGNAPNRDRSCHSNRDSSKIPDFVQWFAELSVRRAISDERELSAIVITLLEHADAAT